MRAHILGAAAMLWISACGMASRIGVTATGSPALAPEPPAETEIAAPAP